ncbi:hypothetical protein BJV78DRAFT_733674 [Lactifluus subvellereus]|nr:hypothetical protein BJV78DRAFT_733674 [Lactifluus subvellereus]
MTANRLSQYLPQSTEATPSLYSSQYSVNPPALTIVLSVACGGVATCILLTVGRPNPRYSRCRSEKVLTRFFFFTLRSFFCSSATARTRGPSARENASPAPTKLPLTFVRRTPMVLREACRSWQPPCTFQSCTMTLPTTVMVAADMDPDALHRPRIPKLCILTRPTPTRPSPLFEPRNVFFLKHHGLFLVSLFLLHVRLFQARCYRSAQSLLISPSSSSPTCIHYTHLYPASSCIHPFTSHLHLHPLRSICCHAFYDYDCSMSIKIVAMSYAWPRGRARILAEKKIHRKWDLRKRKEKRHFKRSRR